jgi:phage protein U
LAVTGGPITLDVMRIMGKSWTLIEGTGRIYGQYVIESVSETKKEFFEDGSARLIDFSIALECTDDTDIDEQDDLVAVATGIARREVSPVDQLLSLLPQ